MSLTEAYVALGGNEGDTATVFRAALEMIADLEGVTDLECSRYYQTKAVSDIPQRNFLNAVCRFKTSLPFLTLWKLLQEIEVALGKTPKPKNAPRIIDLDFLFYGEVTLKTPDLILPHPLWKERSFVLEPLKELNPHFL